MYRRVEAIEEATHRREEAMVAVAMMIAMAAETVATEGIVAVVTTETVAETVAAEGIVATDAMAAETEGLVDETTAPHHTMTH